MRHSYLDYAMSVIVGRALPDARDGLKPVHRRVLFSMQESNNQWNRPYVKCARVVGDVLGKYHPHGDAATYGALVRLVQPFSMRYPLIDGQGNFGSINGDNAAAYRYTECRLQRITSELLADLDKETVDFAPNYDGKEMEPVVLPARFPNLLVNGSSGIAVGVATNIPPHNLGETIDACLAMLANPDITIDELIGLMPAPDFPTAGLIYGLSGVHDAYRTGKGRLVMRARTSIEDLEKGNRQAIIVEEIPYQVNKKALLEKIAQLVHEKKLEGISHIQDESDRSGMRVVIELKRGEVPEIVLNNLYKLTQLQDTFGMNMVALVDGQPRLLNLKQLIFYFLSHRQEVIYRRTVFELRKARDRAHLLEGLAVALANIDEIIELIKSSASRQAAHLGLMGRVWQPGLVATLLDRASAEDYRPEELTDEFGLQADGYRFSEAQAKAILDMQLARLTNLEQDKINTEYHELIDLIADLLDILARPERIDAIISEELKAIRQQFGDGRRSEIVIDVQDLSREDLIAPEDVVVTLSHSGYIKAQPLAEYRIQRRGGRGKQAASTKEDDFIDQLFIANTHHYILCFSTRGTVYWLKVYDVPQGGRASRGRPIVNMFPLEADEKITTILPVEAFDEDHFIFMSTTHGVVKKTPLTDFSNPRKKGIIAIRLDEGDRLIGAALTDGSYDVMLFSSAGKAVRFDETDVRPIGRVSRGVRGMMLDEGQTIIAMLVASDENLSVLTATENGFGKRTKITDYTRHGRGSKGMIAIQTSDRYGNLVGAAIVSDTDELMLITSGGVLIRTQVSEIREMGRSTQGVTLIALGDGEKLAGLEKIADTSNDEVVANNGAD